MARNRNIRHGLEALLFALGQGVIPFLPRCCSLGFSRLFGWLAYVVARGQRRIALANMDAVYGDTLSAREKEALARAAFQTFVQLTFDLFWFSVFTEKRIRRWVRFDASCERHCSTWPAVLLGLHLGNWEILGQALALRGQLGASVAMPLKNPWIDARIVAWRRRTGQTIIPRNGAVRRLLTILREGGRVALLIDQNTKPAEGGVFVDFFGLPAPVSRAAAALAIRAQAPVIVLHCLPQADGGYCAYASEPMPPPADKTAETDFTRVLCKRMEQTIRSAPERWLWMYKRWKYIPAGSDPARYPFYAKRGKN